MNRLLLSTFLLFFIVNYPPAFAAREITQPVSINDKCTDTAAGMASQRRCLNFRHTLSITNPSPQSQTVSIEVTTPASPTCNAGASGTGLNWVCTPGNPRRYNLGPLAIPANGITDILLFDWDRTGMCKGLCEKEASGLPFLIPTALLKISISESNGYLLAYRKESLTSQITSSSVTNNNLSSSETPFNGARPF